MIIIWLASTTKTSALPLRRRGFDARPSVLAQLQRPGLQVLPQLLDAAGARMTLDT
jgi:hypothetical protein